MLTILLPGRAPAGAPSRACACFAVVALCLLSACSEGASSEGAPSEEAEHVELALGPLTCLPASSDASFYTWTGPLPADNGAIMRCQALDAVSDAGAADAGDAGAGVTGYRVLYRTSIVTHTGSTATELPVPATGTVFVPNAAVETNDAGITTRPVVADTHGAVGVITKCAPSLTKAYDKGRIEQAFAQVKVKPVVVVPDYVGLGVDPGVRVVEKDLVVTYPNGVTAKPFSNITHPFVSIESEGRATVDLVRAARLLPNVRVAARPKWITFGQSQGGHAAIGTAEVVYRGYGSDLNLVGVVAGSPGSELDQNIWWNPDLRNSLFGMITASLPLEWRDLRSSTFLTNNGKLAIDSTSNTKCFVAETLLQTLATYNIVDLFSRDPFIDPAVKFALGENSPGRKPATVPMFVGQVRGDPLIDFKRTSQFVANAIYTGNITYCEYFGGTAKSMFEQSTYQNLYWPIRANDHDTLKKMFDAPVYQIGCTNAGTNIGKKTPDVFVRQLFEPLP